MVEFTLPSGAARGKAAVDKIENDMRPDSKKAKACPAKETAERAVKARDDYYPSRQWLSVIGQSCKGLDCSWRRAEALVLGRCI